MRSRWTLPLLLLAAACGAAAPPDRVSVRGVGRLWGEWAAQGVELPGGDVAAGRGPAGIVLLGASIEGARVVGGSPAECQVRRKITGSLVARTVACFSLLRLYTAL